jgi:soluble lytic murein transglycosylase-like protein
MSTKQALALFAVVCVIVLVYGPQKAKNASFVPSAKSSTHAMSYRSMARQDAIDVGINPDLFERQIEDESGFNPSVVSPAGAEGIAQFMPSTAAGMGVNPNDPVDALKGAARLMASYVHRFGSYEMALAAYNAGPGALQSALNRCGLSWLSCLPRETQSYVAYVVGR